MLDETYGAVKNSGWIKGIADRSMWTGIKLRGRKPSPIVSYRCPRCGLLESYVPALHARA